MSTYLPALIWSASNVFCMIIARRRMLRVTAPRALAAAVLGPLAIPLVLAAGRQLLRVRA